MDFNGLANMFAPFTTPFHTMALPFAAHAAHKATATTPVVGAKHLRHSLAMIIASEGLAVAARTISDWQDPENHEHWLVNLHFNAGQARRAFTQTVGMWALPVLSFLAGTALLRCSGHHMPASRDMSMSGIAHDVTTSTVQLAFAGSSPFLYMWHWRQVLEGCSILFGALHVMLIA